MQTGWMRGEFSRIGINARVLPIREQASPLILTIPFAIARTQHMAAERLKQRQADAAGRKFFRLNMAGGLIAGLELMQAAHSQSGH